MKTKLIIKLLTLCLLPAVLCLPAFGLTIAYSFTLTTAANGDTIGLEYGYIIDVQPSAFNSSITPIPQSVLAQAFSSGSPISGTIQGATYGANGLILIALYVDITTGASGVAISMPNSLASTYSENGETWDQFNNSLNFPFSLLPSESVLQGDLPSPYTMQTLTYEYFNYLPLSDPILVLGASGSEAVGTIVAFSSAQSIGTFSFVTQPALSITPGDGTVTVQWPTNSAGFILAQSPDLAAGPWTDMTNGVTVVNTNFSITLPAITNQFFRMHFP